MRSASVMSAGMCLAFSVSLHAQVMGPPVGTKKSSTAKPSNSAAGSTAPASPSQPAPGPAPSAPRGSNAGGYIHPGTGPYIPTATPGYIQPVGGTFHSQGCWERGDCHRDPYFYGGFPGVRGRVATTQAEQLGGTGKGAPTPGSGEELVVTNDGEGGAEVTLEAPQLLNLLGDPLYSMEGKRQAEWELLQAGKNAMPVLMAGLKDNRVFDEREVPDGPDKSRQLKITVANECEELLYQIITPRYRSPHEKPGIKPKDGIMYTVADWQKWWGRNKDRPLKLIQEDVKRAMDAYWQQGGTRQTLN